MKPVIAITCKYPLAMQNYIDAVNEFGGKPYVIGSLERTVPDHLIAIPEYLKNIDGLLLPGGGDINPCIYYQERDKFKDWDGTEIDMKVNQGVSRSRDALELRLCQETLKTDLPVFGICRGIQVMNVAMGGNLFQHTPLQVQDPLLHKHAEKDKDTQHAIEIDSNSRLREIVGQNHDVVNSSHHQSVDLISNEFVVTARSEDGVIEAIENPSKRFVIGVQYHPERMRENEEFLEHRRKLFEAFIRTAKR